MTTPRKIFSSGEIGTLLGFKDGDEFDLGNVHFIRMAKTGVFTIRMDGKEFLLRDADDDQLKVLSGVVWEKLYPQISPFISDRRDELIPDNLRDAPEDPDLESDPTGLKPDWFRRQEKREKDEAALSHADQLIPDEYREKPDPELAARRAAMTPEERHRDDLIPDALRDKDE